MTKQQENRAFAKMLKEFPKAFGRVSFRERLMLRTAFAYVVEEVIGDIKANFDYFIEGKDLEIKTLGERCNQLLKDKGNLADELQEIKETFAQTIENDEVAYETLKLHDQEEIGMLKSELTKKIDTNHSLVEQMAKLEEENAELKDHLAEEVELHLHAEEYNKSLEEENNKLLDVINNQDVKIADLEKENAELKEKLNFRTQYYQGEKAKDQLTIAKDLIHQFLIQNPISDWLPKKAEQFLQEVEK